MDSESIQFNGKKFIRGDVCGFGVPEFEQYKNTSPRQWYWVEGSKKEENKFIWFETSVTDSNKLR